MSTKQKAYKYISSLKTRLSALNYYTSEIEQKNYNYEFIVVIGDRKIKVQVYFGKKGIKTILQGDSFSKEYKEIKKIIFEQMEFEYDNQETSEPEEYIGSDESGKGDLFGPLVIAAVFVDSKTKNKLKQIGVRDSKDLSDSQIFSLSKDIVKIVGDNYNIISISPSKYNKLYSEFKNLNKLLNWAHSKAIDNLLLKTNCKNVITDKFSAKELDITLNTNHSSVKFAQLTKAEKFVGVAAASILARNKFNEWFLKQSEKGIHLIKGSSKKAEECVAELIRKIGKENLSNYAKLHFKTFKKFLND